MERPKGFLDQEHLRLAAERTVPTKARSYELMRIQSGHHVLDLGCGPGTDTIPLAHLVGPTGLVVGIDRDPAMIAAADRRADQAGVSGWVRHRQGEATALLLDADTFDSSRSERMFQHLTQPAHALAELIRVTKPGGSVVVIDVDWGTASIDAPNIALERRLMRVLAERALANGYAGRCLYRLCCDAGLVGVTFELFSYPVTDIATLRQLGRLDVVERIALDAGIASADELTQWRAALQQASDTGTLFGSVTLVLVAGRKP